jgi:proteasome accessory factor B
MSQAKVERLLNLIATLLDAPRPVTSDEVRRRVPGYPESKVNFHRAFERDKEDLRKMGVPIRIDPVPLSNPPAEGYRIRKDEYYLRDPELEPDERAALQLAAATVRLDGLAGAGALWKLGGREPVGDGQDELTDLPADPNLAAVFTGAMEQRRLRFGYRGADRRVDPWRLVFRRGRWYLTGYDHARGDERLYRLDRVEGSVEVEDERNAYTRPPEAQRQLQLDQWEIGDDQPVTAHVLIDPVAAASALHSQRPGSASVRVSERRPDGSLVLEMDVTSRPGFRSFLLTFLEHAEVLDPPELRDDVMSWLGAIAAP